MLTIRIRDLSEAGHLAFDLEDLLHLLGEAGAQSVWTCKVEEVVPKDLPVDLVAAFNAAGGHDGRTLVRLASITRQVIDGNFEARDLHSATPWIRLEVVDSSYWEVWAANERDLDPLRARFLQVEDIEDADQGIL